MLTNAARTVGLLLALTAESDPGRVMDACVAARTPMPDRYFRWSQATRSAIERYRGQWLSLCNGDGGGRPSLGEFVSQAQALVENGEVVAEANLGGAGSTWTWLPGIVWEYETHELTILARQWSAASSLGNDQDRTFWDARSKFELGWWGSPWWKARAGTGFDLCMRLGEVDWRSEYRILADLREKSATAYYRAWAADRIKGLVAVLRLVASSKEICACRAGDFVGGLESLAAGVSPNSPESGAVREAASSAAKAVKSGTTTVRIDNEGAAVRLCPKSALPWNQEEGR